MLDRARLMRRYAPRLVQLASPSDALPAQTPVGHTGVMVAFYLDSATATSLALEGAEHAEDLHLTLAYLGILGQDLTTDQVPDLIGAVRAWAAEQAPISGVISGVGLFNNNAERVTYASVDAPTLAQARQDLVGKLEAAGLNLPGEHGYTPHVTLAYDDVRDVDLPRLPLTFATVTVAVAGNRAEFPLGRPVQVARAHTAPREPLGLTPSTGTTTGTTGLTTSWNPVITTVAGKTILTAPATTERAAMWGQAPNPNPHMLWMQGRFVGAERPNRNGALWSIQDLQLGRPTVAHGPLNWLHQDRHVIGTIADAQFIPSRTEAAAEGDVVPEAHITALSAIWRWLYPDEASVVEMASQAGMLAYSMECISDQVECVRDETADAGCGKSFSYLEFSRGQTCEHLTDRASIRRLVNPTFLGGAVIVPPTRPGWADAHANVLRQAAAMAEKAYEQAGRPDIPAGTWEQMMAAVLTFAGAEPSPAR
jgi:2'-5' RNA ligase